MHIFSFNMLDDTMWVKTSDQDIRLIHADIQGVAQLKGRYSVGWKLCALGFNDSKYYYFDGEFACVPVAFGVHRLKQNGEKEEINSQRYHNIRLLFWCCDDVYLLPNENSSNRFWNITGKYASGSYEYELTQRAVTTLIENAKQPQTRAAEVKKEEVSGYAEPVSPAVDERTFLATARKYVDDALAADTSGYQYSEADIEELFRVACKKLREILGMAPGDEVPSYKEKEDGRSASKGSQLSLAAFRANAPSMTGFRDALLSYRKSLPNNWDYNAFVGILLGVRGPKHGDAACMNFAIGQGDNGNNTKKTLEAKGLMPVFEKYKGKKIDEAILLSDVEDEILEIAPEYAPICQKLHEIMGG